MGNPERTSSSSGNAGLVILIALVVLAVPCLGGLFLAGLGFFWVSTAKPPVGARQVPPPVHAAAELKVEPEPVLLPELPTESAPDLAPRSEAVQAIEEAHAEPVGPESTPPTGSQAVTPE
jgi:hypothetical protein